MRLKFRRERKAFASVLIAVTRDATGAFEVEVTCTPKLDPLTCAALLQRAANDVGQQAKRERVTADG